MSRLPAVLTAVPEVAREGPVGGLLLEHFYRGARIQRVLRLVLAGFFVATLLSVPPARDAAPAWAIVLCYVVWSVVIGRLVGMASAEVAPYVWVALFFDVLATGALTLVVDTSAEQTWTAYLVVNGFFLLPVIAAAQLNSWACGVVSVATVAAYLASSIATRHADTEPWSVLVLRTLLLATVALGCVLLSQVQRTRVLAISGLAADRARLVDELVDVGERERRDLAEHLHDGALQYVLAARQDLEDVATDPESIGRLDHALGEAVGLLRSTLTQLHPAVLEQGGLLPALRDLVQDVDRRGHLEVRLSSDGWPETGRTPVDSLLLGTARELLTNVVKHAGARSAVVELTRTERADGEPVATLVVTDDGHGFSGADLTQRLQEGHLGLASRRIHVEAAGGTMTVETDRGAGSRVTVAVPIPEQREETPAAGRR